MAATRVYDREAEDVFGIGYFSLQIQVSQHVVVESANRTLYIEIIRSIVEEGFDIVSGGQRKFRSNLRDNSLFLSVISVKIRNGLSSPMEQPTMNPTVPLTQNLTKIPTQAPSILHSSLPSTHPSIMPSLNASSKNPSSQISTVPSVYPSNIPFNNPSISPSTDASMKSSTRPSMEASNVSSMLAISPSISSLANATILLDNQDSAQYQIHHSRGFFNNGAVIAGIIGVSALFVSICLLVALFYYRYRKGYNNRNPPSQLSSQNANSVVPGTIQLGDGNQSLADTTLGDQEIVGAWMRRRYSSQNKNVQPLGSFDENSRYDIAPCKIDEESHYATRIKPTPVVRTFSSLSSQPTAPIEYGDKVVALCMLENEDFIRDPSDLDVWSCNVEEEDFDRGSEFYRGESSSRSSSFVSTLPNIKQDNNNSESSWVYPKLSQTIIRKVSDKTPNIIGFSGFNECYESLEKAVSITSTVLQAKMESPPLSPNTTPHSSSKKMIVTSLNKKDKAYTTERRRKDFSRCKKNDYGASGSSIVKPLTKIFESMATSVVTPEENESKCSERAGSESDCIKMEYPQVELNKGSSTTIVSDDDMSTSPWLMEKIEGTLGPKGANADISSISGKSSVRPHHSQSNRQSHQKKRNGSAASYCSNNSGYSSHDVSSIMSVVSSIMSTTDIVLNQKPEEIKFGTSRSTLEMGIKHLEKQLEALDERNEVNTDSASSITMSSCTRASLATRSRHQQPLTNKRTTRNHILVLVPPGKLGVILGDQRDGKGAVINTIKAGSPVIEVLKKGDTLVAVDDVGVTGLNCNQITSLIASRADRERRFTVITNSLDC